MVVFSAIEAKNILMASSRMSLGRSDSTSTKVNIKMTQNICLYLDLSHFFNEEENNVTDKTEIKELRDRRACQCFMAVTYETGLPDMLLGNKVYDVTFCELFKIYSVKMQ